MLTGMHVESGGASMWSCGVRENWDSAPLGCVIKQNQREHVIFGSERVGTCTCVHDGAGCESACSPGEKEA